MWVNGQLAGNVWAAGVRETRHFWSEWLGGVATKASNLIVAAVLPLRGQSRAGAARPPAIQSGSEATPGFAFLISVLKQTEQWLPGTRVMQRRNLALLLSGLVSAQGIQLSYIASTWRLAGRLVSLVNRLRRFLDNEPVDVWEWYRPLAAQSLLAD